MRHEYSPPLSSEYWNSLILEDNGHANLRHSINVQNYLDESLIKCHSINCNFDVNVSFKIDMCLLENIGSASARDLFKDTLLRGEKERREKSPVPGRIQTLDLLVTRHALYHCATTAAVEIGYVLF